MSERGAVAVVGAGTMGRGIAQVAAAAGYRVLLHDPVPEAIQAALDRIRASLTRAAERGRLAEPVAAVLARVEPRSGLEELAEAPLAVEAVPERLELKQEVFRTLAERNRGMLLATNTSTLPVTAIARPVPGPERVVGLHFFNPPTRMPLVEVVPGLFTSEAAVAAALAFARSLGKEPVVVRDTPGFLVNRVARPFYGEALVLAGDGVPFETVDRVLRGLGFPMGPFELMDLIGLDVNLAATRSVWEQSFFADRYRPHRLQVERVTAGWLGQKTGRGFYPYPRPAPPSQAAPVPLARRAHLVGEGPVARALAARLAPVPAEEAEAIVDARVALDRKGYPPEAPPGRPVYTLIWGHSASTARPRYPQAGEVVGFSLVPPLEDGSPVELAAPEGRSVPPEAPGFFAALGLSPVVLPDQPGGVGFRILAMLINEAYSALREGVADAATLDRAMELGTRYPRGPLAWAEGLGLPYLLAGLKGLFSELGEDRYRPDPLLVRRAAVGAFGGEGV